MIGVLRRLVPRRLAAAQDGATAVEFAIVFPVFFLLLFGILEFARLVWAVNSLQYAVAQGARYTMTSSTTKPSPGTCSGSTATFETSIQSYLQRQLTPYLSAATAVAPVLTKACSANPPTLTVTLKATYDFNFVLSSLVGSLGTVSLQQQATVTTPLI